MKLFALAGSLMLLGHTAAVFAQDVPINNSDKKAQETKPFRPPANGISLLPGIPMFNGSRPGQSAKRGAVDPLRYNALSLLLRNDVRGEIGVSVTQREAIEEIGKQKSAPRPLRIEAKGGNETDIRQQIQQTMNASLEESNKTVEIVLHREQIQRLRQIDLRWRGALAIADKVVAEPLNMDAEQHRQASEYLQAYRDQQSAITMDAYKDFMQTQQQNGTDDNGGERKTISMRLRIPDRKEMTPAQRQKFDEMEEKIEKIRAEFNLKALALLTPEQKIAWTKLQGKPFAFRARD